MSYRSQVMILCEDKAYSELKNRFEETIKEAYILKYSIEGIECYSIEFDNIRWYGTQLASDIRNFLYRLNDKEGYSYKIIEIGEDSAIRELSSDRGEEIFGDFYVTIDIHTPPDISLKDKQYGTF